MSKNDAQHGEKANPRKGEWERPVLRRLAANEAEGAEQGGANEPGNQTNSS